jgi:hypothetical protein
VVLDERLQISAELILVLKLASVTGHFISHQSGTVTSLVQSLVGLDYRYCL